MDKVTSLFIHIYPPFVFTVLRHFFPNVEEKYPALAQLPSLNIMRSLVFSSVACKSTSRLLGVYQADLYVAIDLIWQVAYYYGIVVARKDKIEKEGRITSFTYMLHNKKSLIGKVRCCHLSAQRP